MIKRLHSNLFLVQDLAKTAEFYKQLGFDVQVSDDAGGVLRPDKIIKLFLI